MKFSLSVRSFMDQAFGFVSTKLLPSPRSSGFPPVLSSRSFTVLCFTFKPVVNLELIFMKDRRSVPRFTYLTFE